MLLSMPCRGVQSGLRTSTCSTTRAKTYHTMQDLTLCQKMHHRCIVLPSIPSYPVGIDAATLAEACEKLRRPQISSADMDQVTMGLLESMTKDPYQDAAACPKGAGVHATAAAGAKHGRRANNIQEPGTKELLRCLESCAVLGMRIISTMAITTAALAKLKPQLQSMEQTCIYYQGGTSSYQIVNGNKAAEDLCMELMLDVVGTKTGVTQVLCGMLPQPQQLTFTTACRAVQQLRSKGCVIPLDLLLPAFLPMAAVPIMCSSVCCNPLCLQLYRPGDAAKKPQVRCMSSCGKLSKHRSLQP